MENYENINPYDSENDRSEGSNNSLNQDQRKAVAAAVGGTAILGAAAYGLSVLDDSEGADANATAATPPAEPTNLNTGATDASALAGGALTDAANNGNDKPVNIDDLTFDEAFAMARAEKGAGQTFEWRGGLYNTFYEKELDEMSTSERQAFVASLHLPEDEDDDTDEARVVRAARPRQDGHHHAHVAAATRPEPVAVEKPAAEEAVTVVPLAAPAEVVPIAAAQETTEADLLANHEMAADENLVGPPVYTLESHAQADDDTAGGNTDDDDQQAQLSF